MQSHETYTPPPVGFLVRFSSDDFSRYSISFVLSCAAKFTTRKMRGC